MGNKLPPYVEKTITGCKSPDHRLLEGDTVTYEIKVVNPGVEPITGTIRDEVYDFLPMTAEWSDSLGNTGTDLLFEEEITVEPGIDYVLDATLTVTELDPCVTLTFKNTVHFTPEVTEDEPCPKSIHSSAPVCYLGEGTPKWDSKSRGDLHCSGFWDALFPDTDQADRIAKMCDLLNACKPVEALLAGSGLDGSDGADGGDGGNGEGGLTEAEVKALIEACLDPENADGKAIFMALLEACLATDNPDGKELFTAMLAACLAPDNADGKALFTAMIAACLAPDNAEGKAVFAAMLEACMTPDNPEIKTAFEALLTTCLVPGNENVKAAFAAMLIECLDKTFLQEVIAGEANPVGDGPSDTLAAAIKAIVTNCVLITDGPIDGLDYSGTAAADAPEDATVITILNPDGTVLSAACIASSWTELDDTTGCVEAGDGCGNDHTSWVESRVARATMAQTVLLIDHNTPVGVGNPIDSGSTIWQGSCMRPQRLTKFAHAEGSWLSSAAFEEGVGRTGRGIVIGLRLYVNGATAGISFDAFYPAAENMGDDPGAPGNTVDGSVFGNESTMVLNGIYTYGTVPNGALIEYEIFVSSNSLVDGDVFQINQRNAEVMAWELRTA